MTAVIGSRLIPASLETVRDILLRPLELPAWNPAFLEIAGPEEASVGEIYRLTTLRGIRGTFSYTAIGADRIEVAWEVPGMGERCVWTMLPRPGGVRVGHEVSRSGPLAMVLRAAFAELAELRLDRLEQVAAGRLT